MKTPEQLAEEHANLRCPEQGSEFVVWCMCRDDFLAGYKSAKDQLEPFHKGADVYIIDANNPLPKPMPLSIAEQHQFADADKVMTNLPTPAKWISVKERLPEDGQEVLVFEEGTISTNCFSNRREPFLRWDLYPSGFSCHPSHWMPLPEPPKGED